MAAQRILLAYNHGSHDKKALSFVIEAFAHQEEVQVTLINIYAPLPQIDMASSPEMSKIRDRLATLQAELHPQCQNSCHLHGASRGSPLGRLPRR
mgnify:CR=1 FL=1